MGGKNGVGSAQALRPMAVLGDGQTGAFPLTGGRQGAEPLIYWREAGGLQVQGLPQAGGHGGEAEAFGDGVAGV